MKMLRKWTNHPASISFENEEMIRFLKEVPEIVEVYSAEKKDKLLGIQFGSTIRQRLLARPKSLFTKDNIPIFVINWR